ncbi:MAG: ATP-binding protein [Patescibacteria group bacterium]|nr:ATP-binding protein [Patescibacteria group bacterium]
MSNFNNNFITNELKRINPWWDNPSFFAENIHLSKRNIFDFIYEKLINNDLIIAVVGLRRVGKTTLLKQLINELLLKTKNRKTIAYFSFEEIILKNNPEVLEKIILYQLKNHPNEKLYFFFDEVQYVDGWNSILKKYFDQYSSQLKFIVSGSSSLFIKTQARESLAGRILEYQLAPLSYSEYLKINENLIFPQENIFEINKLIDYQTILEEKFFEYLNYGEFPYLKKLENYNDKKQYLLDWVLGKTFEIDLPKLKKIYHLDELINLGKTAIIGSGQLIQMQNLASDLGVDRKTLADYLNLLEKSYLIKTIYNLTGSFRSKSLRQRKIYSSSVNAVAFYNTSGVNSESFELKLGQLVETFVLNYLLKINSAEVYFFKQRDKEIDFILKLPDRIIPIEVKFQNQIKNIDLKNLIYFCQKKNLKEAIVITKNLFEKKEIKNILFRFLPAYFLI